MIDSLEFLELVNVKVNDKNVKFIKYISNLNELTNKLNHFSLVSLDLKYVVPSAISRTECLERSLYYLGYDPIKSKYYLCYPNKENKINSTGFHLCSQVINLVQNIKTDIHLLGVNYKVSKHDEEFHYE